MTIVLTRFAGQRLLRLVATRVGILALAVGIVSAFAYPQSGQIQQPKGTWQTPGPIQQPRGTWQKPGDIQVPKGIQAIKQQDGRCSTKLVVGADALFEFNRWTLEPDAAQTLDALGPLIAKAGKHPARIEGFTDSIGSDSYNQMLSEKRAITVRGWLVNHGYVPEGTPIKGFGKNDPVAANTKPDGSDNPEGRQKNRRVEVVIDTCN
jgi:outer membrane protein OmpA-like peptidoglycan-associated protein